jgi:phosphosulfolactate phosphohydrolase-like enzyme
LDIPNASHFHNNSPVKAFNSLLKNKKVLLMRKNETVALHSVKHCDKAFVGAFVNSDALVKFILKIPPENVP